MWRGTMSKVLMTIDVMHRHPDADWVVWMDDDTWINPSKLLVMRLVERWGRRCRCDCEY